MNQHDKRSLLILLPNYTNARHFLRILQGVPYSLYRATFDEIWGWRGTPQEPLDWKDPDTWIPERLNGERQVLAQRIWDASGHELNPRYVRPLWRFTGKHGLQTRFKAGVLETTERGQQFLNEPQGQVVAEIDRHEGLLNVLQWVADLGPGKHSDFLTPFTNFCTTFTTSSGKSSIRRALSKRLKSLLERGYVQKQGHVYEVTERGREYLARYTDLVS